ncbi:50S ribosomal protein L2, partial [Francisella tularensis subsp. holarctica]|nr:50S ribosomal protein L2 [Francisella tularensis subsp. holarctica]
YDPKRCANIALVIYADGERIYNVAQKGLKKDMSVISGEKVDIAVGNCMPMRNIRLGTVIDNVEVKPKRGGHMSGRGG